MEKQMSICPANGAVEMQKSMVIFALFNPPIGPAESNNEPGWSYFFCVNFPILKTGDHW